MQTEPTGFRGRVVVIAGGRGGLGQAVVPLFVQAGAQVVLVDRQGAAAPPEGVLSVQADVTEEGGVRRMVEEAHRRTGRVDVLVNLVGGFATGRLIETDLATWQRMATVNLSTAFLLSKAVLPSMLERRAGRILHVAARAAVEPFPGAAAYIVAKAGLVAMVRTLALELAGSGVTVNGVLPGTMDTPANRESMPRADPAKWVKPDAVAEALLFLASDAAGSINGALIPVG
ncbi:MAG TPA: SDR family NAD(P)-dependent oxidoreductase [Gemmataceae bacterium]|nr:SDR family NAD(P)-dependent oxidoreductase [Gemmataceae bacterium]